VGEGVAEQQPQPSPGASAAAQLSADRLAVVLEEIGFDVGRAFPMLSSGVDRDGAPGVELGRVALAVADQLATVLAEAVRRGVTVPSDGDWRDAARPSNGHDRDAGN
jgi:hypothetical protein